MLSIHILTWNDEVVLPYTIQFYISKGWAVENITIWDNKSTDKTPELIISSGCKFKSFNTQDKFDDTFNMKIKNECWKLDKTNWILVTDCDEWVDVTPADIAQFEKENASVICTKGFDIISDQDTETNLDKLYKGVANVYENKPCLFSKKHILSMNYGPGAHSCNPVGFINWWNKKPIPLYHMKYFSEPYLSRRYNSYRKRLSDSNKNNGWSHHYTESDLTNLFRIHRETAVPVIVDRRTADTSTHTN